MFINNIMDVKKMLVFLLGVILIKNLVVTESYLEVGKIQQMITESTDEALKDALSESGKSTESESDGEIELNPLSDDFVDNLNKVIKNAAGETGAYVNSEDGAKITGDVSGESKVVTKIGGEVVGEKKESGGGCSDIIIIAAIVLIIVYLVKNKNN